MVPIAKSFIIIYSYDYVKDDELVKTDADG